MATTYDLNYQFADNHPDKPYLHEEDADRVLTEAYESGINFTTDPTGDADLDAQIVADWLIKNYEFDHEDALGWAVDWVFHMELPEDDKENPRIVGYN